MFLSLLLLKTKSMLKSQRTSRQKSLQKLQMVLPPLKLMLSSKNAVSKFYQTSFQTQVAQLLATLSGAKTSKATTGAKKKSTKSSRLRCSTHSMMLSQWQRSTTFHTDLQLTQQHSIVLLLLLKQKASFLAHNTIIAINKERNAKAFLFLLSKTMQNAKRILHFAF